jgi:hypothetical protein
MLRKKKALIFSLGIALAALPLISYGVMSSPDYGVNQNWRPGQGQANAAINNGNGTNGTLNVQSNGNSNALNSQTNAGDLPQGLNALQGSVDLTLTLTGIDATSSRIAVNGMWFDAAAGLNRLAARYPKLASLNLVSQLPMALSLLRPGDTLRVKASIQSGMLKVQTLQFDRPGTSAAEVSLKALFNQAGRMMSGLKLRI